MEGILAQCSQWISGGDSLMASVLVAGLLGSLTHCSTMCGPMVAVQSVWIRQEQLPVSRLLALYHAGRISSYMLLGTVAGGAGGLLFGKPWFPFISGCLLMVAGGLFVFSALYPKPATSCQCGVEDKAGKFRTMSPGLSGYLRGVLLGFMPCGLVMAVLLMVTAAHDPLLGGLSMVVFGLTTVPVLQLVGMGACTLSTSWKNKGKMIGRSAMTVNGLVLCVLGLTRF